MKMKYTSIISAFLFVSTLLFSSCVNTSKEVQTADEQAVVDTLSVLPSLDSLRCVEGKVKSGQFFSTLMTGLGLNAQEAYDLTMACDTVFDVKNLRVGNEYKAYYDGQILKYVLYRQDRTSDILFECQTPHKVSKVTSPVTVRK